ncbi:MAG: hypothetical protein GY834_13250 [Bacteroidetes bacterium]|nr:hypothetical protein [Bacteroidota bacterium]
MSKIEIDGFLSEESEKGRLNFNQNYQDIFDFSKELNQFCMKFMREQKIDWENKQQLIIKTLHIRILENFQAVFLILERGMMPQAKILTRAMLETVFILVALQKKPELVQNYLDQHEEGSKRTLKAFLQFKNEQLRAQVKENKIEENYIAKKNKLKEKELNPLTPKQWAVKAELEDFYSLYYTIYSNAIHSNLSALNDHMDESEKEPNLSFGPSDEFLYDVLKCGFSILFNATSHTALAHGIDIAKQLDNYAKKLKQFDKKYM